MRVPKATLLTTLVTCVATGLGLAYPTVTMTLERRPTLLESREWWRLLSPILVNPEGWRQVAVNAIGLVAVGTALELLSNARTWLASYLGGAVCGEVAGLAWQPTGAGSSVAICGLLGALAVTLWRRVPTMAARVGAAVLLGMGAALTYASNLHGPPILAGAVVAMLLDRRARQA
jgi:rhomboid protease GluP